MTKDVIQKVNKLSPKLACDRGPGPELRLLLRLTRSFPQIRGFGRLGGLIARFYNRKERPDVIFPVLGFRMVLQPGECVDDGLLFCPTFYERLVVKQLIGFLKPGHFFLDAGANIGFYSLLGASIVGSSGRVLAIEADQTNFAKLTANVELNEFGERVVLRNLGLSDSSGTLRLGLNLSGNRGAHSFLTQGDEGVMVQCEPLLDVLRAAGIEKIDVAKFDIEGFEFRVLKRFLESAPPALVPRVILLEQTSAHRKLGAGDALTLLRNHGFQINGINEDDYLAVRS
jgi:FkbM family methyltransferase